MQTSIQIVDLYFTPSSTPAAPITVSVFHVTRAPRFIDDIFRQANSDGGRAAITASLIKVVV